MDKKSLNELYEDWRNKIKKEYLKDHRFGKVDCSTESSFRDFNTYIVTNSDGAIKPITHDEIFFLMVDYDLKYEFENDGIFYTDKNEFDILKNMYEKWRRNKEAHIRNGMRDNVACYHNSTLEDFNMYIVTNTNGTIKPITYDEMFTLENYYDLKYNTSTVIKVQLNYDALDLKLIGVDGIGHGDYSIYLVTYKLNDNGDEENITKIFFNSCTVDGVNNLENIIGEYFGVIKGDPLTKLEIIKDKIIRRTIYPKKYYYYSNI
ncbi:hypothetical protein [Fusobacterium periodonticum]|jgi:hypothetical protein|uniref:Uncharacterized protein n=1 Tax=Fusobacterium periodonticum D10 TaxID=620833 RepID=K1GJ15_9FUSO|nr:hypothetical protein [Fusobacterium periodonticum]EKA93330.1 hypothetical protein FPOG_02393 [Fusobacterium periodonticum D10]